MVEITDNAKGQLDLHFQNQEASAIRIYIAAGCGGPRLALALDEQNDNDSVHEVKGYTFLVEKSLMETASPITIDFNGYMGFSISSSMQMSDTGGGCSSCSSCG